MLSPFPIASFTMSDIVVSGDSTRASRRPIRARGWMLGGVVVLAGVTAVASLRTHRHLDSQLAAQRASTIAAMARLERVSAAQWDPEGYTRAEHTWRAASEGERTWRALPLFSARAQRALSLYGEAQGQASAVERASLDAERVALQTSADMVRRADEAVASTMRVAEAVHLARPKRAVYQKARLALYEAQHYHAHGDYVSAADRARHAIDLASGVRQHAAGLVARFEDPALIERWRSWHRDLVAWTKREGKLGIVVDKAHHRLHVYELGRHVEALPADMGFNWVADKKHAGDGATPEGRYRVAARKGRGASLFYKALLLDYPNPDDRREFEGAKRAGALPSGATIGGLIEIHGEGGRGKDWTKGCVAVANREMDLLFAQATVGTPVVIVGSLGGAAVIDDDPLSREGTVGDQ